MTLGLTYVRGLSEGSTTEGNSPTREAGCFNSPFLAAPVRSSGPHRVQIPVGSMFTAQAGAVILMFDPDNANGGAGQQSNGLVFDCRTDANNRITLQYDKSNTRWQLDRIQSGTATNPVQLTDTFSAADKIALYIGWDSGNLYIAVDGGSFTSAVNARNPALPITLDIGSQDGATASTYFNAAYAAVAFFSSHLALADWQALAALRALRPPLFGERVGSTMTGLWYGADSRVLTLPSTGTAIDLKNLAGVNLEGLMGAGVAPVQHRMVETPLGDGAVYVDSRLTARRLVTQFAVHASSIDSMFDLRRVVAQASNPRRGMGRLYFTPYDQVYQINALLNSGIGYDGHWAQYQLARAEWMCPDPAWLVAARNEAALAVPAGGWSITWSIPWSITPSSVTQAVTNSGDLDSYPYIEYTAGSGGCIGPYLVNGTTGEAFSLPNLEMSAGQVLIVDMDARTVTISGSSVMGYRSSDSRMWALQPGSNSVTAGAQSGSATVRFAHYTRLVGV